MDLHEFVTQTLIQICEGIAAARAKKGKRIAPVIELNEKTDRIFFTGNGVAHLVSFDVAVTVTDKNQAGGKAGIQVMSVFTAEGGKSKAVETSSVSRVRFDVPISYGDEE